jgi:hypothetical protein
MAVGSVKTYNAKVKGMSQDDVRRRLLFWAACIPTRLLIGVVATTLTFLLPQNKFIQIPLGLTALAVAASWIYQIYNRKPRGVFGGIVWWNQYRYLHFLTWGIAGILALLSVRGSGTPLLIDAIIGISVGLLHYYGRVS